jgi:surfactin synthase thioesterase subunit
MNELCDELAELAAVTCTVEDFTEVAPIAAEARAADAAGAHVVLVGHSMGADAAIKIATEIARPPSITHNQWISGRPCKPPHRRPSGDHVATNRRQTVAINGPFCPVGMAARGLSPGVA